MAEPPDFDRLFRSVARSAVHLEMRDDYGGSSPAFAARRARIISEPASHYIRFEYEVTPAANLAAGEHVRWLPRAKASDLALPGNDFWLFDGTSVLFNYFSGDGAQAGTELQDEPAVVKLCTSAFEAVWERAVSHGEYRL